MFLWSDAEITRMWVVATGIIVVGCFIVYSKGVGKINLRSILKINDDLENIESIPEAIINIDEDNYITKVNENVEDIFGYMGSEIKKASISRLLLEENMEEFNAFKSRPFRKGVYLLLKTQSKNKESFDAEIVTRKYFDATGKAKYSVVVRDVSHREAQALFLRTEFERQTKEVHKRIMLLQRGEDIGKWGTWEWDLLTRKVDGSVGFRRVFNIGMAEELNSDMLMELIYPPDQMEAGKLINKALIDLSGYEIWYRRMQKDGSLAWIFCRGEPILSEDETEVIKVYGVTQVVKEDGSKQ